LAEGKPNCRCPRLISIKLYRGYGTLTSSRGFRVARVKNDTKFLYFDVHKVLVDWVHVAEALLLDISYHCMVKICS